jgi:hypothetical protein
MSVELSVCFIAERFVYGDSANKMFEYNGSGTEYVVCGVI